MKSIELKRTLIGATALLATFTVSVAHADDVIVQIGHVAPLTGSAAYQGKDSENGAQLAIDEINQKGLVIAGKHVHLVLDPQDDAGDPRQATQVAQKLIDDGVVAVVGHMNSGTSIPAAAVYSAAGVPQISPAATNPDYTRQGFKTTFRLVATDAKQGPALASYAVNSLHAKRFAIADDATAYGQGLATEFEKTVKAAGGVVVAREASNDKAIDFKAILTRIKSERPDVIMYGGMYATGGPLLKQASALGIKNPVLGGDGVCTEQVVELAGDAVKQLVCSEPGLALSKMPKGAVFAQRYEARFHGSVQQHAPFSYDAVYVIVDAMKRANSVEAAKLLAALPATSYDGVTGHIAFDSHGDLRQSSITLYDYRSNKKSVLDAVQM